MALPRQSSAAAGKRYAPHRNPVLRWNADRIRGELQQERAAVDVESAGSRSRWSGAARQALVHGRARAAAYRRHECERLRLSTGNARVPGLEQRRQADVHAAVESDAHRNVYPELRVDSLCTKQLVLFAGSRFDPAPVEQDVRSALRRDSLVEVARKRQHRTYAVV